MSSWQNKEAQAQKLVYAFALAFVFAALAQAELQLVVVDNLQSQYTAAESSRTPLAISPEGAACIEASLLGLPCTGSTAKASGQAEALLTPDIFRRPEAVVVLRIAGQLSDVHKMAGGRVARQEELAPPSTALQLSASLQTVISEMAVPIHAYRADFRSIPGCSDACMETLLQDALLAVEGNYTAGPGGPMQGVASVWQSEGASARAVELDLMQLPVRLWAAELASLHHATMELITEKARREAQNLQKDDNIWVLEGTLVGLQALHQAAEVNAAQQLGAELTLQASICQAQDALSHAFADRVAAVVALLGKVPAASNGLRGLLQWQSTTSQAALPQDALKSLGGTLPTGGRDSLNWQTDSAAWLSFSIIVLLLFAAIYCLTNMQFKKDSLLYGRAKAD